VTSTKTTTFNSEALSGALVKFYNYGFVLQLFQAKQREHRAQLEQANQLQQTQLEDVQQQLRKANQQLDQAVTDNEKLNDDVLAKTQQVKQYKKQVDGLKAEVAAKHAVSYMYTIISIQMWWHGIKACITGSGHQAPVNRYTSNGAWRSLVWILWTNCYIIVLCNYASS